MAALPSPSDLPTVITPGVTNGHVIDHLDIRAYLETVKDAVNAKIDTSVAAGTYAPFASLAALLDTLITGVITRNANGAATSAPVVWPDGQPGTYTADTLSTAWPGAVDAYHVTYGSPATKTYTQPAVTRNSDGAVTTRPAIVVS